MIITVFTKEERAQLEEIDRREVEALTALTDVKANNGADSPAFMSANEAYKKENGALRDKFTSLIESFLEERFKGLKTPAEILEDAKEQIPDAIIYSYVRVFYDVDELNRKRKNEGQMLVSFHNYGFTYRPFNWDFDAEFLKQKSARFNPGKSPLLFEATALIEFIKRRIVDRHLEALKGTPESEELTRIITDIVKASPYAMTAEASTEIIPYNSVLLDKYMPFYHGQVMDALASLTSRDFSPAGNKKAAATSLDGKYTYVIRGFDELKGKLSINTHKLLCVAIAEFTRIFSSGSDTISPEIRIPFEDYARALGYPIDERETNTEEEAEKEKKRAREVYKNAWKAITRDIEILNAIYFTGREKSRKGLWNFDDIELLDRGKLKDNYIVIRFGITIAENLSTLNMTQYPKALLSIDARRENAYRIGLKMATYFNMYSNQENGTHNRLRVSTLLAVTQLPTYEALQNEQTSSVNGKAKNNARQWSTRIKEPFETALDALTGKVISSWEYVKEKGIPLTNAEAYSITDYYTFSGLLVQFELLDAPDFTAKLEQRKAKREAADEKKEKKKPVNKKPRLDVQDGLVLSSFCRTVFITH